jgi:hypothetical protein
MVRRFRLPRGRPLGLPDFPALNRVWTGGRPYPTVLVDDELLPDVPALRRLAASFTLLIAHLVRFDLVLQILKADTGLGVDGALARVVLPATHDEVAIGGVDFDDAGLAPCAFSRVYEAYSG